MITIRGEFVLDFVIRDFLVFSLYKYPDGDRFNKFHMRFLLKYPVRLYKKLRIRK